MSHTCVCVCFAAGPLTIQEALTYVGGAAAGTTGLVTSSILLALLRRRRRQKGKLETVFSSFSSCDLGQGSESTTSVVHV